MNEQLVEGYMSGCCRAVGALITAFSLVLAGADGIDAQTYQGTVVEARTGEPIEGALVRGTPGGYVDVTLEDGIFIFGVPAIHRPLTVEVSRQGYATRTFLLEEPATDIVLELQVSPIELEGISTEVTLETRLERVEEALNQRYATHRGIFRTIGREEIRAFDSLHESDPYAMLTGGLELYSDFDAPDDVMRSRVGWRLRFEVFLDDIQVPLATLLGVPNDQLCRAEMFHTTRLIGSDPFREPGPQLRAYTCSFMARVAIGAVELEDRVCWNELVAWRTPTREPSGCTYRR